MTWTFCQIYWMMMMTMMSDREMVMLMSVMVTPFGVVAAVYLREYASQGPLTRLIRIAVNNL